jgi:Asp-tRNA(Asn)/Glu-tRNA(Gln) amidotransferase A subunit family amidase
MTVMANRPRRLLSARLRFKLLFASGLIALPFFWPGETMTQNQPFHLLEATVEDIHNAYKSEQLTARQLVQLYLDRIDAYDKKGPRINAIITISSTALAEAERLDAEYKASGLTGPLHGIPVIVKDQMDVRGMPTTLGSILFKDYRPERDAFVAEKLRKAGAIILAKATLGELGGGDTHGSLFGSTRNPYGLERTAGGSSGGSGAAATANFAAIAVGQEGFASIRRPSGWNGLAGMRPTAGLVSRSGVFDGWPQVTGSLGPMTRTVTDLARLLDVMVGYDPEDPLTAMGVGHVPESYTQFLDANGLRGARIGVLRESMGFDSEPDSPDFAKVTTVFNRAISEIQATGATMVDPVVIPNLKESLAKRAPSVTEMEQSFEVYFGRSAEAPFESFRRMLASPEFSRVARYARNRLQITEDATKRYQYLQARDELMIRFLKLMADNRLDAIVYKAVEHQPTFIEDGTGPPWVNTKGIPFLNTFLTFVPAIVVPAGFTTDNLPAGITFMAGPYKEGTLIKLAYAYEQATRYRKPPASTPKLANEP